MARLTLEIRGLDALLKKLRGGGDAVYAGPWRDAMQAAAITLENAVKQRTPVDIGRLRASITHRVDPHPVPLWAEVGTNVKYAPLVEFGTRPHEIVPRTRRALFWKGAPHPVRRVRHPGTAARRMFQEGLAASTGAIQRILQVAGRQIVQRWER